MVSARPEPYRESLLMFGISTPSKKITFVSSGLASWYFFSVAGAILASTTLPAPRKRILLSWLAMLLATLFFSRITASALSFTHVCHTSRQGTPCFAERHFEIIRQEVREGLPFRRMIDRIPDGHKLPSLELGRDDQEYKHTKQ
jgi:hypothetical protein